MRYILFLMVMVCAMLGAGDDYVGSVREITNIQTIIVDKDYKQEVANGDYYSREIVLAYIATTLNGEWGKDAALDIAKARTREGIARLIKEYDASKGERGERIRMHWPWKFVWYANIPMYIVYSGKSKTETVQERLIASGWALYYQGHGPVPVPELHERWTKAQEKAKEQRKGMWGLDPQWCAEHEHKKLTRIQ